MAGEAATTGQVTLPNGGQVTTDTESPAEKTGAMQSWLKTAPRPAAPSSNGGAGAQPPAAVAPAQPPAPKPPPTAPVVTSTKRGGLLGVMDSVTDALVGKTRPEVGTDAEGNAYVKQHTLTRGEQWMRIAGEAMRGAAAGLAAGRGAGNMGKAALAGMQAQQQASDKEKADVRADVLDRANAQMLRMKMAELTWQNSRRQVEATQQDIAFWQGQEDRIEKHDGIFLGTTAHPGDIADIRSAHPDVMKDLVKDPTSLAFIPRVDEKGVTKGFAVYKTDPQKYGDELEPVGTKFPTFNTATGNYEWHTTTAPTKQKDIDQYWNAAGNAALDYRGKQKEIELKGAQQKNVESEQAARDKELPGKMAETAARTAEARANASKVPSEIDLTRAKTQQIKSGAALEDGTPNPRLDLMANAMLNGDVLPADLKREAKGAGIDPNTVVARAMELAQAQGQTFSLPMIEQEHNFAKNPKTQAALDGIDRVLGTAGAQGYIDQMLSLARDANLGPVGFGNSLTLAVRRKFGDTAAKNLETSIAETRRSIAGLIGNPLLGGSETDKKLQQAEEMLGKDPTIANLEGASTILKNALGTQKTSLIQNNRYLRRRYGTAGAGQQPPAERPAPARPPNVPATAHWDWNANGGSGMWVP